MILLDFKVYITTKFNLTTKRYAIFVYESVLSGELDPLTEVEYK